MKILMATKEGQGQRKNDFMWCEEGEPVIHGVFECDDDPDGPCGCLRSWVGTRTRKATTTAKVVNAKGMTWKKLRSLMIQFLVDGRFIRDSGEMEDDIKEFVEFNMKIIAGAARLFPVGAVIERRGMIYRERKI